ncbi:SURF1 family cytochrome oxidase biogenesis protein [Demequina activiva]|uniref:SURF1 family cytochrome oxidase biogenesis protein n=1 Tax=Demequina activiva TaxID=1582364 RepID=UPI001940CE25|nr:SURF1 family cytochrome oxidase biogenesis protein [Demequina activiva]
MIPAAILAAGAVAVCGALGWWQWTRASEQGEVRQPDPAVPIADLIAPATGASGIGRDVWADGAWADADVALIPDREVEGEPAVLVVRAFRVGADATGTGETATLPVVVGWLAPEDVEGFDAAEPDADRVEGHLRSAEGAAPAPGPEAAPPEGTFWASGLSPAVLAQQWESPLYSALLTATEPEPGLTGLPLPDAERSLDFRSLTYAIEWWLFGAFFVFIAGRWIRDNGRARPRAASPDAPEDPQGGPS